jgi:hypothetical protein
MVNIFEITDEIRNLAKLAFLDLHRDLSRQCRLYYPPRMITCINCQSDPIGRKSSNRYLHGGPAPFPLGSICPMCGGTSRIAQESYDDIQLLIDEEPDIYKKYPNANLPQGIIEAKGLISDMSKVLKCDYLIKDLTIRPYLEFRYTRYGEPVLPSNIVLNEFFISLWQRS